MAADREPVPGTMADPIPAQPGDPSPTAPDRPAQPTRPAEQAEPKQAEPKQAVPKQAVPKQAVPKQAVPKQAPPKPTRPGQPRQPDHALPRTRLSGVWAAVGCFTVILVLLLIFILQNSRTVDVSYLGAHGHLSLGVAMLLAAACGALLVTFAGMARILQLRATARKHRRADRKRARSASAA